MKIRNQNDITAKSTGTWEQGSRKCDITANSARWLRAIYKIPERKILFAAMSFSRSL